MNRSMISCIAGMVAFAGGCLLDGPQFLSDAEAATIVGGDCENINIGFDCFMDGTSTCQDGNPTHFFNPCTSSGGACVRCRWQFAPIGACVSGFATDCGFDPDRPVDCGVECFGYCQSNGSCNCVVPGETECDDYKECCNP